MADLSALRKVFRLSIISLIYMIVSNGPIVVTSSDGADDVVNPANLDSSLEFGDMTTLIDTDGVVYNIEIDLRDPNVLIFSRNYTLDITDGVTTDTLVGSTQGYAEGTGTAANFNYISAFTQMNETAVIVSDEGNDCLRIVSRDTLQTSQFVGKCLSGGFVDGVGADSRFDDPYQIIKDIRHSAVLLVADYWNNAVREVDVVTRAVTTLIQSGLDGPRGLALSMAGNSIIITNNFYISEYNLLNQSLITITGSTSPGYKDGRLNEARFNHNCKLISLSEDIMVVADYYNSRLRVVNTSNNTVTSICTGWGSREGPIDSCQLNYAMSLVKTDTKIYVGQLNAIRVLPYYPMRKRLDFIARYDIRCDELDDEVVNAGFLAAAEVSDVVDQVCAGDCQRDKNIDLTVSCENDITTVNWPTDLQLTMDEETAEATRNKFESRLRETDYCLRGFVSSRLEPIVTPIPYENGDSASIALTTICVDGYKHHEKTDTCFTDE